ncbi:MAG: DUF6950 family protein [Burkholderiaceae bacterium]
MARCQLFQKMRHFEWQLRFAALISSCADRPFNWGAFDCARFAAECVESITGKDVWADVALEYGSEREALRRLKNAGGLRSLSAKHLGQEISPSFAQPGDIGWLEWPTEERPARIPATRETLVVNVGRGWLTPASDFGLAMAPRPSIAWRCDPEDVA